MVQQHQDHLRRQGQIVVNAKQPLQIAAAEHVAQHLLGLLHHSGKAGVLPGAAHQVLRLVFRQLLRRFRVAGQRFPPRFCRGGTVRDQTHPLQLFIGGGDLPQGAAKVPCRALQLTAAGAQQVDIEQGHVPIMGGEELVRCEIVHGAALHLDTSHMKAGTIGNSEYTINY